MVKIPITEVIGILRNFEWQRNGDNSQIVFASLLPPWRTDKSQPGEVLGKYLEKPASALGSQKSSGIELRSRFLLRL